MRRQANGIGNAFVLGDMQAIDQRFAGVLRRMGAVNRVKRGRIAEGATQQMRAQVVHVGDDGRRAVCLDVGEIERRDALVGNAEDHDGQAVLLQYADQGIDFLGFPGIGERTDDDGDELGTARDHGACGHVRVIAEGCGDIEDVAALFRPHGRIRVESARHHDARDARRLRDILRGRGMLRSVAGRSGGKSGSVDLRQFRFPDTHQLPATAQIGDS